jgi:iron(III) transport system ATP-binding protein
MLSVEGIGRKKDDVYILQDISFTQQSFQHLAIAGETGSGKSTLLRIIAGFIQPDEGRVMLNGEKVKGPDDQLVPGQKGVGYLSQHFELRNNYWVHEVLEYANKLSEEDAKEIFHVCQIDHLLNRRTTELSGGEKQRIATARLLVNDPILLLLDEPYSNLDMIHKQVMKKLINDISVKLKISSILVSHDPSDILSWAEHLIILKDGMIVQQGMPEDVYRNPANEYCAGMMGAYYLLPEALAASLAGETRPGWNGGRILIRPEHILIAHNDQGLEARLKRQNFLGSKYEYIIEAGGMELLMYGPSALPDDTDLRIRLHAQDITTLH